MESKKKGEKKSLVLFAFFLPIMLAPTRAIQLFLGINWSVNLEAGIMSFVEAFTEEFFFRGILFVLLTQKTNVKIAYITSLTSFTLMHPQNLMTFFLISTLMQGILTVEIARKSQNILGAWLLHGSNRFFQLVLLPLIAL